MMMKDAKSAGRPPRVGHASPRFVRDLNFMSSRNIAGHLLLLLFVVALLQDANAIASPTLDAFNAAFRPLNPAVTVEPVAGMGHGLVATRDVEAGEVLLSVPRELTLSPTLYLSEIGSTGPVGAQIAEAGKRLQQTAEGASCLLALALLHERALGERSKRALYVSMLPQPDSLEHSLLWEPSRVESLLKGSHLVERIRRLRSDLSREISGLMSDALVHEPATFPPEVYTEALYTWAHAILLSRALPVGGDRELTLVPLLDFANHDASSPHVWRAIETSGEQGFVALVAGSRVVAGEHVCIDCSRGRRRATWEYFFSYGMVPEVSGLSTEESAAHWLEQGAFPMRLDALRPPEEDAISMQKRALLALLLDALGFDESSDELGIEITLTPDAPAAIAPFLRLGFASRDNAAELAETLEAWKAAPLDTWEKLQRPLSDENERLVAERVLRICEDALEPLPPSLGLAMAASADEPPTEERKRERAAARVLLGERHALEACRDHWKQVLEKL